MDLSILKKRMRSIPFAGAALATASRYLRGPVPSQIYSIDVYAGQSLDKLAPREPSARPAITARDVTDIEAIFVADPFLVRTADAWHMYFEVLPSKKQDRLQKGVISLATSADFGMTWNYEGVVLKEAFHLSYPYVFEYGGEYYMVPETHERGAVSLYRAAAFPRRWEYVKDLLIGNFTDATVLHRGDSWWMFVESVPEGMKRPDASPHSCLRLYYADTPFGPWEEHPLSPISRGDAKLGRPAGRPLVNERGGLIRFAQDCSTSYGAAVYAVEVENLDRDSYSETPLADTPILAGSGMGWNADGMHHLDAFHHDGRWHAAVDGWRFEIVD